LKDIGIESGGVINVVRSAVSSLQSAGHFGPYAVLMLSGMWEAASKVEGATLADRVIRLVLGEEGQLVPIRTPGTLKEDTNKDRGIVISKGTGAFDLVEVSPASLALVEYSRGDLVLRVEERIVLRVLDSTAARNITLKARKAEDSDPPPQTEK
jgi:uncharacterized linocin/CFP29 family protein